MATFGPFPDELLRGQSSLPDPTLSDEGQALAQRYAAQHAQAKSWYELFAAQGRDGAR